MGETAAAESTADLCEQFDKQCVLVALSRARDIDPDDPPDVYFLDEDSGRIHRMLDATRGAPDSGWFVLALAGPHPDDSYERQLRIHDTEVHHVFIDDPDEEGPATPTIVSPRPPPLQGLADGGAASAPTPHSGPDRQVVGDSDRGGGPSIAPGVPDRAAPGVPTGAVVVVSIRPKELSPPHLNRPGEPG